MPDWTKIANTIATGMYGEDWDKAAARKSELESEAQRRNLLQSAESRAQAAEGREADEFGFKQSQRAMLSQRLEQEVEAGRLSNDHKKRLMAVFDASGGAEGEAQRILAEEQRKANEDKRSSARLGIDQGQFKLQQESADLADRRGEEDLAFTKATNPSRQAIIEAQADPRMRYEPMIGALAAALRSPGLPEQQAQTISQKILDLQTRGEAEALAWQQRHGKQSPTNAPAQVAPQAAPQEPEHNFFGALEDRLMEWIKPKRTPLSGGSY